MGLKQLITFQKRYYKAIDRIIPRTRRWYGTLNMTMVIPSYWSRESAVGWKGGDAIYDHPTPLDTEGTLQRAIESIEKLEDKEFQLVTIAVANAKDIKSKVEKKVANIIESANAGMEVTLFGPAHLREIHDLLRHEDKNANTYSNLLQLRGYPHRY